MSLHAQSEKMAEDVCEVGKTIGLRFKGDAKHMFSVLAQGRSTINNKVGVNEGQRSRERAM